MKKVIFIYKLINKSWTIIDLTNKIVESIRFIPFWHESKVYIIVYNYYLLEIIIYNKIYMVTYISHIWPTN